MLYTVGFTHRLLCGVSGSENPPVALVMGSLAILGGSGLGAAFLRRAPTRAAGHA